MIRTQIVQGDITTQDVDAIVNAANTSLLGGGGVDGAIHAAAGPDLLAECEGLSGCKTGEAKITKGYNLNAKYVIHTVGPVYSAHNSDESARLLKQCYLNSLALADEHGIQSIAFPGISIGAYGYPKEAATQIARDAIREYFGQREYEGKPSGIELVVFVAFDAETSSYMTNTCLLTRA